MARAKSAVKGRCDRCGKGCICGRWEGPHLCGRCKSRMRELETGRRYPVRKCACGRRILSNRPMCRACLTIARTKKAVKVPCPKCGFVVAEKTLCHGLPALCSRCRSRVIRNAKRDAWLSKGLCVDCGEWTGGYRRCASHRAQNSRRLSSHPCPRCGKRKASTYGHTEGPHLCSICRNANAGVCTMCHAPIASGNTVRMCSACFSSTGAPIAGVRRRDYAAFVQRAVRAASRSRITAGIRDYEINGRSRDTFGVSSDAIFDAIGPRPSRNHDLDHIVPLVSFNMLDEDEFRRAWSPNNLQWLTSEDNMRKSDSMPKSLKSKAHRA